MDRLITDQSCNWFLSILINARRPERETMRIMQSLINCLKREDLIGIFEDIEKTIQIKPLDQIADDCFFSTTFFNFFINKHSSLPNAEFYTKMGKSAFTLTQYSDITKNWNFWQNFCRENIILD